MRIYVAGNLLVEKDSLPLRMMPRMQDAFPKIDFKEFDPNDEFPDEDELIIIDAVEGLDDVYMLKDIEKINLSAKTFSVHDFDLGSHLKLMKKLGKLDVVKIICVPIGMDEDEAFQKVVKMIKEMMKSD
jgi:Ni,Fe-hydrogenase maturation factor